MNLIAIEASTEMCSVGLLHNDRITHKSLVAPQKHAELILGSLEALLQAQKLNKSSIQGIVLGQGPGAFTGVRIGLSIVQGLALALDVPVLPISTMHNMAWQLHQDPQSPTGRILIANDARMGEVYWASFVSDANGLKRECPDQLAAPDALNTEGFEVCAGSAFQTMIQAPANTLTQPDLLPNASALLTLGAPQFPTAFKGINSIQPQYIREQVVQN